MENIEDKLENNIETNTNFSSPLGVRGSFVSPLGARGSFSSPLGVRGNMFYGALPILFQLAKELRNNQTEAEIFLWNFLTNNHFQTYRFKRQHPVLYFIADFYCHKAKIIIEVDGGYHNSPDQFLYDRNRDCELEELGLKVLRFTNEQVLNDIENTLKAIEGVIKEREKERKKQPLENP